MTKPFMSLNFEEGNVQTIYPPITPYLFQKLEKKYVDYLWKIIKKERKPKKNINIDLLAMLAIVLVS